jgi:hypothetical protein
LPQDGPGHTQQLSGPLAQVLSLVLHSLVQRQPGTDHTHTRYTLVIDDSGLYNRMVVVLYRFWVAVHARMTKGIRAALP